MYYLTYRGHCRDAQPQLLFYFIVHSEHFLLFLWRKLSKGTCTTTSLSPFFDVSVMPGLDLQIKIFERFSAILSQFLSNFPKGHFDLFFDFLILDFFSIFDLSVIFRSISPWVLQQEFFVEECLGEWGGVDQPPIMPSCTTLAWVQTR